MVNKSYSQYSFSCYCQSQVFSFTGSKSPPYGENTRHELIPKQYLLSKNTNLFKFLDFSMYQGDQDF